MTSLVFAVVAGIAFGVIDVLLIRGSLEGWSVC